MREGANHKRKICSLGPLKANSRLDPFETPKANSRLDPFDGSLFGSLQAQFVRVTNNPAAPDPATSSEQTLEIVYIFTCL